MVPRMASIWQRTLSWMALTLALGSGIAWGQEIEEPLYFELGVEVGFFARSAPELAVRVGAQREGFNIQFEVSRSLEQTPSWRLALAESMQMGNHKLSAEANWEPAAYSLQLGLETRGTMGQLAISVLLSPPEVTTWTLRGDLQWRDLRLQLSQLRWQGDQLTVQGASLTWTPAQILTISGRWDGSKPLPLEVEAAWALPNATRIGLTGRFAQQEGLHWAWREADMTLARGRLNGGLAFSPLGWQEAWVERNVPLSERLEARGKLRVGPAGWLSAELGGRWNEPLAGSLQAGLTLSPDGWRVDSDASYWSSSVSFQGKLGAGPRGISNLLVTGRASPDGISLDGLFNYTGSFWLLNLSGALSQDVWTLSGSSSWTSLFGWDKASLGLGREFIFGIPTP